MNDTSPNERLKNADRMTETYEKTDVQVKEKEIQML